MSPNSTSVQLNLQTHFVAEKFSVFTKKQLTSGIYIVLFPYFIQDDIVTGTLTVRENLYFSAALRLPSRMSMRERKERVAKVISELRLDSCANRKVILTFWHHIFYSMYSNHALMLQNLIFKLVTLIRLVKCPSHIMFIETCISSIITSIRAHPRI